MKKFSDLKKVFIIAEIGVNHNGDIKLAKELVLAAKKSGADAVKFQTYVSEKLASPDTPKVEYQYLNTSKDESHYEMLKSLELTHNDHIHLLAYCKELDIEFLSTPYDISSAEFLMSIGVNCFKTASADLVDLPLQSYIASLNLPTIIATGMANLGEIERVVRLYEEAGNKNVTLLHCVSNYPCSDQSLNLLAMDILSNSFLLPVGYSDHSEGTMASVIAVAKGAKVIEKHFTLDKTLSGPDHKASSSPDEFSELVFSIRRAEIMLGKRHKICQPEERQMAIVSRKSIVLSRAIQKGEILDSSKIELSRPGDGLDSSYIPFFCGKTARESFKAGHKLHFFDVED